MFKFKNAEFFVIAFHLEKVWGFPSTLFHLIRLYGFRNSRYRCTLCSEMFNAIRVYAVIFVIDYPFARQLFHATTRLAAYFKLWRLKVNMDKTETILFTKRRPDHPPLQGMTIPWSSEVKYLGLRLTQTLNYSPHIKRQIGKAIGALIKLFPILSKESTLTTSTKILLYKTSIRSIISYAVPVWCSVSDSTYKQLQILQNKCLRVILNAPRRTPIKDLHCNIDIERLQEYLLHLSARFYTQCTEHTNPLVAKIGHYEKSDLQKMYKRYIHKRPKHALL